MHTYILRARILRERFYLIFYIELHTINNAIYSIKHRYCHLMCWP